MSACRSFAIWGHLPTVVPSLGTIKLPFWSTIMVISTRFVGWHTIMLSNLLVTKSGSVGNWRTARCTLGGVKGGKTALYILNNVTTLH